MVPGPFSTPDPSPDFAWRAPECATIRNAMDTRWLMLGFVAVVSVGASSGRDQAPDWIYGTWRWKFSGVSFVLNNETPASCRCNRYLQFHRDGTYEYIEQGSA